AHGVGDRVDLGSDVADHDVRPLTRQGQSMGATLPAGPAGDQRNPSVKLAHGIPPGRLAAVTHTPHSPRKTAAGAVIVGETSGTSFPEVGGTPSPHRTV